MSEKRCFKCGEVKPIGQFYKHFQMADGHLNKCKDCTKTDVKNRADVLSKDIGWRIKERGRGREKYHRLYKGNSGSGTNESKRRHSKKYPERRLANHMVNNAIREGRLERGVCEVCGNPKVHGHHDDYYKPLEVRWLCATHHHEHHVKLREEKLRETL